MALTTTRVGGASATTASLGSGTLSPTVTAGDLLICYASQGNGGARITGVSDDSGSGSWTLLGTANSAETEAAWWYKWANGSETIVTVSYNASSAADMVVTKTTGWVNSHTTTPPEDFDENTSHMSTATGSPFNMGSVTNTTASAVVITWAGSDGLGTLTNARSVSDGSAYTETADQGSQIYTFAREVSSVNTYSPVYTHSDSGDQLYTASVVFGDSSGGGGGGTVIPIFMYQYRIRRVN